MTVHKLEVDVMAVVDVADMVPNVNVGDVATTIGLICSITLVLMSPPNYTMYYN